MAEESLVWMDLSGGLRSGPFGLKEASSSRYTAQLPKAVLRMCCSPALQPDAGEAAAVQELSAGQFGLL